MIDTKGLSQVAVLQALYAGSKPQGMGFLHARPGGLSVEEATAMLAANPNRYFDYVSGRVLKVDLSNEDEFDPFLYDRDLGQGAAQRAIDSIRVKALPLPRALR